MALEFSDVYDRWQRSKSFGDPRDLSTFSTDMNDHTGTNDFDAGVNPGWWKQASHAADVNVFNPIAKYTGLETAGRAIGGLFGDPYAETGARIGRSLPRTIAQTLPLAAAEFFSGGAATPVVAGALASGGLFGAQTYAETGDPTAAAISGATAAALPAVGRVAGKAVEPFLSEARPVLSRALKFGASQAAQVGTLEAGQAGQAKALGQPFEPFSPEFWAQQIPFSLLDLYHTATKPVLPEKLPVILPKKKSDYVPPKAEPVAEANLSDMLDRMTGVAKDQTITPEEKAKAFSDVLGAVMNPETPTVKPDDRVILIGHPKAMDNGSVKLFATASKYYDLANHSNVFINNPKSATQFQNPDGSMTFITNRKNVSSNVKYPLGPQDFAALRQKGQKTLPEAAPPTGEGVQPETDLLSLRQKFQQTVGNETMFQTALRNEPKDEAQKVPYWQQAIDKMTPAHLKEGYESPFDSGEQTVIKEAGVQPEELTPNVGLDAEQLVASDNPLGLVPAAKMNDGTVIKGQLNETHGSLVSQIKPEQTVIETGFVDNKGTYLTPEQAHKENTSAISKTTAQIIETSQAAAADAQEKLDLVPKTAEETTSLIAGAEPKITDHVKEGATPTQAVEKVRLQTQTPVIDKAKQQVSASRDELRDAAKRGKAPESRAGFLLDKKTNKAFTFTAPDQADAFLAKYKTENPEDSLNYRVAKVRGKWKLRVQPREVSLEGGEGTSLENSALTEEQQSAVTGRGQFIRAEEEVPEATVGGVPESAAIFNPDAETRPEASFQDYLAQLDLASQNPTRLRNAAGFDDLPTAITAIRQFRTALTEVFSKGKTGLKDVNEALKKAGMLRFDSEREMQDTFKKMRSGLEEFTNKYRSFALDSQVPHDAELANEIGVLHPTQGATNFLDWFIRNQKPGLVKDLAEGLRKFSDFAHVNLTNDEGRGFWYQPKNGIQDRPQINLNRLPSDREDALGDWGNTVLHELSHDSISDLKTRVDPAAMEFKATLQKILRTVRDSPLLPAEVRKAIKLAVSEDWAGKGAEEYNARYDKALPGRDTWKGVHYSLLNEYELVSGIFDSPELVRILQETKMQKTGSTVLNFFANAWAKLFGYTPNASNAFAKLLTSYDNYLSGTRNPKGYNAMSYMRDSLVAVGVKPEGLASRLDTVAETYNAGDLAASIKGFEREAREGLLPATTVAGPLNDNLKSALVTGDVKAVGSATDNLLADELPQHRELWFRMKEDLKIAKNLYDEAHKGNVYAESSLFQEGLKNQFPKLNAMKNALDKQDKALARWQSIDALGNNEGIARLWSSSLKGGKVPEPTDQSGNEDIARQALGLEAPSAEFISNQRRNIAETGAKPTSWIDKTFKFASFTSEEMPGFKPIYSTTHENQSNAYRRMTELTMVKNSGATKGWDRQIAKSNKRVHETPGLDRIASDILRRAQVLDKQHETFSFTDPEVAEALKRASTAKGRGGRSDRDDIITAVNSEFARSQHYINSVVPEHLTHMNQILTSGGIIGREIGMPYTKAWDLAGQMYTALGKLKDPAQAPMGAEELRAVASQMQPDTFIKVLQQSQGFITDSERHLAVLQKYSHYVSEQRYGNFHLVMSREGEPLRESSNTEKAARSRSKELQSDGWVLQDIIPKNRTNVANTWGHDPVVSSMQELDQQALNRFESLIADLPADKREQLRPLVERAADYQASNAAFTPVPTQASPRRRFVPGRETIDMLDNAEQYYRRSINWMRHRETRAQTAFQMLDPEILGNRPLREYAQTFVDNQLAPDNPVARRLAEATFYWNLAGNLGVDFLHSIQSLTTGMASVIAETGSTADALKYVTGASGKVFRRYTTGKWGDKNTEFYINWQTARGGLGLPAWGDIFDPTTMNYFHTTGSESTYGKTLNAVKNGVRGYKGIFLRHNDMVGGLAGFQLGLDRGMSLEDAAHFGEGVKDRGFYSAGKVQRPVGLWSIKEKAVPQLLSALRTYTLGWFSQLSHNYKVGFAHAPGEFSAAQRQGAKQAFAYMLGAQAVLAGALGLPGVGQGLGLLKQTTGLDLKGWTRKNLAAMFGEDQEDYGGFLTGMAMHGLVAQFAPFDPSGRHIPNFPFIGVTPTKGFDVTNLIPAPFTTAADIISGLSAAAKGQDPTKALPQVLRGPVNLLEGGGDIRNSKGELIYQLSPSERVVKSLGLEPSRVAAAKETAATVSQMNKAATEHKSSLVDQVATLYRRGDTANAQKQLAQIQKDNPTYDMASFVRAVSGAVEKQTIPFDWKRSVNPALDIEGLSSGQPSREIERSQLRHGVASDLGLYERPSLRGSIRSASIDDLMNSDPYVTRASALQRLLTARQLRGRNISLSTPEFQ